MIARTHVATLAALMLTLGASVGVAQQQPDYYHRDSRMGARFGESADSLWPHANTAFTRPHVVILICNGFNDLEFYTVLYRFVEEGYYVCVAAPQYGTIMGQFGAVFDIRDLQRPGTSLNNIGPQSATPRPGMSRDVGMAATSLFQDVIESDYDALYIPGGNAIEQIYQSRRAVDIIKQFADDKKLIGAIDGGIEALSEIDLLNGRTVTGNELMAPRVRVAGGTFKDSMVVEDGNFVTSRMAGDLPAFLYTYLRLLRQRAQ